MTNLRQDAINAYLRSWVHSAPFPRWAVYDFPTYWQVYTDPPLDQGYYLSRADPNGDFGGRVTFFYGHDNPTGTISVTLAEVDQTEACDYINNQITSILQNHTRNSYWFDLPFPTDFDEYIQYVTTTINTFADDNSSSDIILLANKILGALYEDYPTDSARKAGVGAELVLFVVGRINTYCKSMHNLLVVLQTRLMYEKQIWIAAWHDRDKVIDSSSETFRTWDPGSGRGFNIDLNLVIGVLALAAVLTSTVAPLSMVLGTLAAGLALVPSDTKDLLREPNKASSFTDLLDALDKALNGAKDYQGSIFDDIRQRETELFSDVEAMNNYAQSRSDPTDNKSESFAIMLPEWMSTIQYEDPSDRETYEKQQQDGFYVNPDKMHDITSHHLPDIMKDLLAARDSLDQAMNDYPWRRPSGLGRADSFTSTTGAYGQWLSFASAIRNLIDENCAFSPIAAISTLDQVINFVKQYMGERVDLDDDVAYQINNQCRPQY